MFLLYFFVLITRSSSLLHGYKVIEVENYPLWFLKNSDEIDTVVLRKGKEYPKEKNEESVVQFILKEKDRFLIQYSDGKFMCSKAKKLGISLCENKNDPSAVWKIIEMKPKNNIYKIINYQGLCLRAVNDVDGEKVKWFNLNLKDCSGLDYEIRDWKIKPLHFKNRNLSLIDENSNINQFDGNIKTYSSVSDENEDEYTPYNTKRGHHSHQQNDHHNVPVQIIRIQIERVPKIDYFSPIRIKKYYNPNNQYYMT